MDDTNEPTKSKRDRLADTLKSMPDARFLDHYVDVTKARDAAVREYDKICVEHNRVNTLFNELQRAKECVTSALNEAIDVYAAYRDERVRRYGE